MLLSSLTHFSKLILDNLNFLFMFVVQNALGDKIASLAMRECFAKKKGDAFWQFQCHAFNNFVIGLTLYHHIYLN